MNIEREQRRMKSIERIRSSTESCRCQLSDTTITLPGIMGVMQEQTAINSGLKTPPGLYARLVAITRQGKATVDASTTVSML